MGVSISQLPAATNLGEADEFEIEQGGVSKKITKTQLRSLLFTDPALSIIQPVAGDSLVFNGADWVAGPRSGWRTVPIAAYTETPPLPSSSSITFAGGGPTSGVKLKGGDYFQIGSPVRVEIGAGIYYYGICTSVSDTLLVMSGMIMPTGSAILSLAVGTQDMVVQINMNYAGTAASDVYTGFGAAVAIPRGLSHQWRGRTGYLVAASVAHTNTAAAAVINFKMNAGTNVLTTGVTPAAGGSSTTQGAFVNTALGEIIAAHAAISDGQAITTVCTSAGAGTAESLVACLTFIVP